jgi:CHAD domain-containing protein
LQKTQARKMAAAVAAGGLAAAAGKAGLDRRSRRARDRERRYRLRKGEPVGEGLRRIARGQIDAAAERLRGDTAEELDVAVHEARKGFKRLRAAVRLARDGLGADAARRENAAYRDTARRLAAARDAQVMVDTLDDLCERYAGDIEGRPFAELRAALAAENDQARRRLEEDESGRREALGELERARARVAGWSLDGGGTEVLEPGLRRVYRRGRRGFRAARADPTTENLHEWRKRAKDLWHAAQIVQPAAPGRAKRLAGEAHRLSDLLGLDHDLAVLRTEALRRRRLWAADPARRELLCALIDRRRDELRREALELGAGLYRRKPRAFTARLLGNA